MYYKSRLCTETLPVINKSTTTGQLLENPGFTNSTAQLQA